MYQIASHSAEQTQKLSQLLGKVISTKICIALEGPLGAGKTCFVQGLARGLEITELIQSPTFSILHEHYGRLELLHADLYRLEREDLPNLDLEELFDVFDGPVIVEWAYRFPELLPLDRLWITIQIEGGKRTFQIHSNGSNSERILHEWKKGIGA